jgi:hypothetical protein
MVSVSPFQVSSCPASTREHIYSQPVITPHGIGTRWDGETWKLDKDWHIEVKKPSYQLNLQVKAGFITDGGSVPRLFQNVIPPLGIYLPAFLAHDALYATEYLERSIADWILLDLLQELGATWYRRNQVYLAVRAGGWLVWKHHTPESILAARDLVDCEYKKL